MNRTRIKIVGMILLAGGLLSGCGASRSIYSFSSPSASGTDLGKKIFKTVNRQLGVKYRYGGDSPRGFDCSGLAWWSHKKHGVDIPRVSSDQFKKGKKISRKKLQAGDLVFFTTNRSGPSHLGTYDGKGSFIHAPSSGKRVKLTSMDNPYWKSRYLGARRYW